MNRKVEVRGWYGKEAVVGDWSGGIWVDIMYRSGLKGRQ